MEQAKYQHTSSSVNSSLRLLLLAFFAPVYFAEGVFVLRPGMLSSYAGIYMRRNIIAALLTYIAGELFNSAEFFLLGTPMLVMFVIFSGLCGVYLAAMFDKHRNHG